MGMHLHLTTNGGALIWALRSAHLSAECFGCKPLSALPPPLSLSLALSAIRLSTRSPETQLFLNI